MKEKIVRAGKVPEYKRNGSPVFANVFCRVTLHDNGRLSITGVVGPLKSGNAYGSCGQIVDTLRDPAFVPRDGFNARRFADVWDRWHLNDMRAGSPAQETYIREHLNDGKRREYPEVCALLESAGLNPDPETGYRYGSAWMREEVPADVIAWLFSDAVPVTDVAPAWV